MADIQKLNKRPSQLDFEGPDSPNDDAKFDQSFIRAFHPSYEGPRRSWKAMLVQQTLLNFDVRREIVFDMTRRQN